MVGQGMKTNSERLNQLRTLIRGSQFTSEDIFETAINQIVNQTLVTNVDVGAVELLEEVETIVEIMQRLEADERLQALDFACQSIPHYYLDVQGPIV